MSVLSHIPRDIKRLIEFMLHQSYLQSCLDELHNRYDYPGQYNPGYLRLKDSRQLAFCYRNLGCGSCYRIIWHHCHRDRKLYKLEVTVPQKYIYSSGCEYLDGYR